MDDYSKKKSEKIKRSKQIHIRITPDEEKVLKALAAAASMNVSDYMRNVALGYQVVSKADEEGIRHLLKAGADMGRLGGLLKKLLTMLPYGDITPSEIRGVLKGIEASQADVAGIIAGIKKF